MSQIKARLNVLSEEQIQTIHDMAITILEKTGIRVDDPNARAIFKKATGQDLKDNRVSIPREIVEWAVEASPSKIDLLRRDGLPGFSLDSQDNEETIFGIGVTNLYYQDPLTDKVESFTRDYMAKSTRLGNHLDEFDTIATPGVLQDVSSEKSEMIGFLEMLANTVKPITLLISEPESFEKCLTMCDRIAGENATQTSIIPYFNPITPLILNAETTIKMEQTISRGMPFIFSNYGMSGATCPITSGGTLALLTAELLAGLVFAQLIRVGTPVILGSLPAAFDMKKMQSFYTPQSMMINLACGEMMTHYNIPHCGTSGGWMGRGPDLMASSMLWQNHLTSILGSPDFVPFVGNNFDSLAFSPSTVVYAAEIIRLSRELGKGFSISPDEVGLEEIIKLGPGASYLTSGLTMKKFKEPLTKSEIWSLIPLEEWLRNGEPKAGNELREYTHSMIEELPALENHDKIIEAGEEYLRS